VPGKKEELEMPKKNIASHGDAEHIVFKYVCECEECGAEGDLTLDVKDGMRPFNCPEGCGAVYVPWKNPLNFNRWELNAVVMPMFR
jgi:hypothetical protein